MSSENLSQPQRARWRQAARRWLGRAVALALGLLICLLMLEGVMRVWPQVLGIKLQNLAFSKYDVMPDGIYFNLPRTGMRHMKRSFETRMFQNGYWWLHQTDANGFRNPDGLERKGVLLLGDSLIYGHGVDEEQTVSHFLRAEHGHAAYNMGQQGSCLYDHYVLLRLYMDEFKPKVVLLFIFLNDFKDTETRRMGFLDQRPELELDYTKIRARLEVLAGKAPPLIDRVLFKLDSVRLVVKTYKEYRNSAIRQKQEARAKKKPGPAADLLLPWRQPLHAGSRLASSMIARPGSPGLGQRHEITGVAQRRGWVPDFAAAVNDPVRLERVGAYYDAVLADLGRRCHERRIRLVVVNLHLPKAHKGEAFYTAQERVRELLSVIAERHQLELVDTEEAFQESGCYLPNDGHLTEKGHRLLARFLHQRVLSRAGNPPMAVSEPAGVGAEGRRARTGRAGG
jgi:hypothetical protein